ncbi:unnamed protein product [Rotaria magnacalcarata]|uniref:Lamin n=1 Tax=Rotaria magnacalcarata TaxID=392030 RepID=A0A8S2NAZ0_9BILA|nr:unnamed protein product [Rotaria magnacalcarata]
MANRSSASLRSRNTSSSGNTSGLNISRAQEKEQLETLNNRLAVYIDTVRRLEQDNKELKSIIASYTDTYEVETSKVKQLYERELEDAKKLIEELAREKSRLEIDAEKSNAEAQDALAKLARKERELRAAEGRLRQYEVEMGELKVRNEAIGYDANRKSDENVALRGANSDLDKQVIALKRQLESETLLRIDLENKNKTLREELQFNEQVHETLMNNSKQDVSFTGWVLKRKVGSQTYEFKFPKGMVLKGGATTTIWSSDVNDISVDPPTNLKLRTAKWFSTGNESKKTFLEDSDGRVIVEKTVTVK